MRQMVTATLDKGRVEGVKSWHVTLVKVQSLVLIVALDCRAGDVSNGFGDRHELPSLSYGDLTIMLVGGDRIQDLRMTVQLRNNKGERKAFTLSHDPV